MDKLRVMAVFGTRPEGVKMAPVIQELQKFPQSIHLYVAVTGQHREMLDQILQAFKIAPDCDLDIMKPGQSLFEITCHGLQGLDKLIQEQKPQLILAQGDTTTTFAASLAAFYHHVDFGHVEAGLRSGSRDEPFPEEMNRRMTTLCATMHFAPTPMARQTLLSEGVSADDVWMTGNTVIDSLRMITASDDELQDTALAEKIKGRRVVLVTAHRRENWGEPMSDICQAVRQVVKESVDSVVVFSMHKNPVVRQTIMKELGGCERVHLIEPPDYFEFVKIMKRAHLILTDSGGVQEEAPSLGRPVLVLRNTTERPEGLEAGSAKLVGTSSTRITEEALKLLGSDAAWNEMAQARNPYGDGLASQRIREAIFKRYRLTE